MNHPTRPPESPEAEAVETIGETLRDLVDVAEHLPVPADRAEATARILTRLSEELAEAAAMVRALPGRPADADGHDWQLLAALRTAHTLGEDVAETIARALARLAAELGSSFAVLANRPGSWEAASVRELLRGTVGPDDEAISEYRATP